MNTKSFDPIIFLNLLFKNRIILFSATSIFIVFGLLYALSLDNIYKSEAIIVSANPQTAVPNGAENVFSILSGGSAKKDKLDIASYTLKSEDFFRTKILNNDSLIHEFFMAKDFDEQNNRVIFINNSFKETEEGLLKQRAQFSFAESFGKYNQIFQMELNPVTGYYHAYAEHTSPNLAQRWLSIILDTLDEYLKQKEINISTQSIKFLESKLTEARSVDLRQTIITVIESNIASQTLAETREYFVFDFIQRPSLPIFKDRPRRTVIMIFFALAGLLTGALVILLKDKKDQIKKLFHLITSDS